MQGKERRERSCKGEEDYVQRGKERDDDNEAEVERKITRVFECRIPANTVGSRQFQNSGGAESLSSARFGTHVYSFTYSTGASFL